MNAPWVVVTGAGSGIGLATAQAFANQGARLALCDVDAARLAAARAQIGAPVVIAAVVDVADRAAVTAFAAQTHAASGGAVDVVVNNAGVAHTGRYDEVSPSDWSWLLGINLHGVIHGCEAFAPPMVQRQRGHIFNVASVLGMYASTGMTAYCTSKFAVLGYSHALRADLRAHGVHVTAVCPGMIATNIVNDARFAASAAAGQGKVAHAFTKGSPPSAVAKAIIGQVGRDRAELPVGADGHLIARLARTAPALLDAIAPRILKRFAR